MSEWSRIAAGASAGAGLARHAHRARAQLIAGIGALAALLVGGVAEEAKKKADPPEKAIVGRLTYRGPIPIPVQVPDASTTRPLIEVDAKSNGIKDAVVWLEGPVTKLHPERSATLPPVKLDQQGFFFLPHVLAVEEGRDVTFLNSDPPNHGVTAASLEPKNAFNVIVPPSGMYSHRFVADKRPIALSCPLHAGMGGWIYVFDHRHFAVTNERGEFSIPLPPPGKYSLKAHHADGGLRAEKTLTIDEAPPATLDIELVAKAKSAPGKGSK